jgi:hypothetical protein
MGGSTLRAAVRRGNELLQDASSRSTVWFGLGVIIAAISFFVEGNVLNSK